MLSIVCLCVGQVHAMVERYVPYRNIGMRRKQMKQAKGTPKGAAPFSRFIGDTEVKLDMKYRSHYLFGNLKTNRFQVNVGLSWDIHIDTKPADNGLMIIAKSEQGPLALRFVRSYIHVKIVLDLE